MPLSMMANLESHGARLGDFFGCQAALDFGKLEAEYQALAAGVAVVDQSARTRIELTGADRARLLHNLCTTDINKLAAGSSHEAFITNVKGHTIGHGLVICQAESLLFDTVPGQADSLLPHFDKYIIREDVTVTDLTAQRGELLIAGPQAQAALAKRCGGDPPAELLAFTSCEIGGVTVTLGRVDLLPDSWLLSCPADQAAELWQELRDTGAVPCGLLAADARRIEHGYPHFGRDITDANLPQEVNRNEAAINFTKGCYLGQETVARLDALGHVNKTLVRLRGSERDVPPPGEELQADGKSVGQVTSSAWSPGSGAPVALGYVRRGPNKPGTQLTWAGGSLQVT